jgi:hypothetical protein
MSNVIIKLLLIASFAFVVASDEKVRPSIMVCRHGWVERLLQKVITSIHILDHDE